MKSFTFSNPVTTMVFQSCFVDMVSHFPSTHQYWNSNRMKATSCFWCLVYHVAEEQGCAITTHYFTIIGLHYHDTHNRQHNVISTLTMHSLNIVQMGLICNDRVVCKLSSQKQLKCKFEPEKPARSLLRE